MLKCLEEYREELKSVLKKYGAFFPTELPKIVPPNHRFGDEMWISLKPDTVYIY